MDSTELGPNKDFAYFATGWIWPPYLSDVMKSMLLFFDAIAIALPPTLASKTIESDPILATPLAERGLLVNFDPSIELDSESAGRLAKKLRQLIRYYPDLEFEDDEPRISAGHWGVPLASRDTKVFERALEKRRLLERTDDPDIVAIPSEIRLLVLAVFAQTLRARLEARGIALHPVTNEWRFTQELDYLLGGYQRHRMTALGRHAGPSGYNVVLARELYQIDSMDAGQVVADLSDVGTDLSQVPLDEVLDFRRQYAMHYRAYAAGLREFLATQALLSPAERDRVRLDRQQIIRDQAADLRRISRTAFGLKTSALLIALAGAGWTVTRGDPFGALLAALLGATQAIPTPGEGVSSYTYLFDTRKLR